MPVCGGVRPDRIKVIESLRERERALLGGDYARGEANSIVWCDNVIQHLDDRSKKAIRETGAILVYLPRFPPLSCAREGGGEGGRDEEGGREQERRAGGSWGEEEV